ncbi:MAG: hypothetical protein JO110_12420 [Acetobacteraceae bacterium]|nr:hypothetical protein [Acetobacteraceae bacterium]
MSSRYILVFSCGIVLLIVAVVSIIRREALDTVMAIIGVMLALPPVLTDLFPTSSHATTKTTQSTTLIRLHSLKHGLYGGLVGGLLAGFLIGFSYYAGVSADRENPPHNEISELLEAFSVVIPIIIFGTLSGALLGALVDGAAGIMTDIARLHPGNAYIANEVSGGVLGGLVTGLIMGPIGGWWFGQKYGLPVASPVTILTASGPGLLVLVLAILGYIRPSFSRSLFYAALISTVFGCAVLLLAGTLATAFGIDEAIKLYFVHSDKTRLLMGGLYFGVFCGTVWGIVIGLALILSRAETPPLNSAMSNIRQHSRPPARPRGRHQ